MRLEWCFRALVCGTFLTIACNSEEATQAVEEFAPDAEYTCGSVVSKADSGGRAIHVPVGESVEYETNPPCIGNHYGLWVDWGVYESTLRPEFFVHNMEHGGITYLYDCPEGCPEIVASLTALALSYPPDDGGAFRFVLVPFSGLPTKVAAAAWGHAYTSDVFCEDDLRLFKSRHYRNGPEDVATPGVRPGEEHTPHNNDPAPVVYDVVKVTDSAQSPLGPFPGADIDAVVLRKSDGSEHVAVAVSMETEVDCADNPACEPSAALGDPDTCLGADEDPPPEPEMQPDAEPEMQPDAEPEMQPDAEPVQPTYVSLNHGFVLLSFEEGVTIEDGDTVIVHELAELSCLEEEGEGDTYSVSIGAAGQDEAFVVINEAATQTSESAVVIP